MSEGVLWNFKKKRIAQEVLDYFEIDASLIPDITPTFSEMGKVHRRASEETGLAIGTAVTYRAGDQPNNALSLNVLQDGEVAATSGTSGVVYGIVDQPIYDPQSRVNAFAHVNYENNFDRIGVLLCINGAGIEYSWVKQQIALSGRNYNDMERMASTVPVGSEGICILPFGNGSERIFNDRNLESHIFNVEFNRHTRAHLYRASLEGVAFSFVYGINLLKDMGLKVDVLKVGNDNMFRSKVFSETISTLLGCQIEVVDTTGAIGAARASGVANGIYNTLEQALEGTQPSHIFEPNLNYGMCTQAYNYWLASLNKILNKNDRRDKSNLAQKLIVKNEKIKKELKAKNKIITNQAIQIDTQQEILDSIKKSLSKLDRSSKNAQIQQQLLELKKLVRNQSSNHSNQNIFEEHFDLLNDNFIKRLSKAYPFISFEELKMCALLKMKLSTKEIASKLNLSSRGIETKRYRLRKKLNLPKGENLIQFFDQL